MSFSKLTHFLSLLWKRADIKDPMPHSHAAPIATFPHERLTQEQGEAAGARLKQEQLCLLRAMQHFGDNPIPTPIPKINYNNQVLLKIPSSEYSTSFIYVLHLSQSFSETWEVLADGNNSSFCSVIQEINRRRVPLSRRPSCSPNSAICWAHPASPRFESLCILSGKNCAK